MIPFSLVTSLVWTSLTYYVTGYSPEIGRFFGQFLLLSLVHFTSVSFYRFLVVLFQTRVAALTACTSMPAWLKWVFWADPLSYGEIGLSGNELLAPRWQKMMMLPRRMSLPFLPHHNVSKSELLCSLLYSAWLRLPDSIDSLIKREFVNQVLESIELDEIKDLLVGTPGVSSLSTEQRKRLTIAVELVSNPSIIFLDEPATGLDARAAAIVMRAVKNVASAGRTVVCTIHQPSIRIFEAFDEVLIK